MNLKLYLDFRFVLISSPLFSKTVKWYVKWFLVIIIIFDKIFIKIIFLRNMKHDTWKQMKPTHSYVAIDQYGLPMSCIELSSI